MAWKHNQMKSTLKTQPAMLLDFHGMDAHGIVGGAEAETMVRKNVQVREEGGGAHSAEFLLGGHEAPMNERTIVASSGDAALSHPPQLPLPLALPLTTMCHQVPPDQLDKKVSFNRASLDVTSQGVDNVSQGCQKPSVPEVPRGISKKAADISSHDSPEDDMGGQIPLCSTGERTGGEESRPHRPVLQPESAPSVGQFFKSLDLNAIAAELEAGAVCYQNECYDNDQLSEVGSVLHTAIAQGQEDSKSAVAYCTSNSEDNASSEVIAWPMQSQKLVRTKIGRRDSSSAQIEQTYDRKGPFERRVSFTQTDLDEIAEDLQAAAISSEKHCSMESTGRRMSWRRPSIRTKGLHLQLTPPTEDGNRQANRFPMRKSGPAQVDGRLPSQLRSEKMTRQQCISLQQHQGRGSMAQGFPPRKAVNANTAGAATSVALPVKDRPNHTMTLSNISLVAPLKRRITVGPGGMGDCSYSTQSSSAIGSNSSSVFSEDSDQDSDNDWGFELNAASSEEAARLYVTKVRQEQQQQQKPKPKQQPPSHPLQQQAHVILPSGQGVGG